MRTTIDPGMRLLEAVRDSLAPLTDDATLEVAGRLLGVPAREVREVRGHPVGVQIVTADGAELLWVSPETPDGQGKSGLMAFIPTGRLPVFLPPELADVGELCHVDTFTPVMVADCDEAVAAVGSQLGQVRSALALVTDVDKLEELGDADRRLVATLRGLENVRPRLVEDERRAVVAAEERAEQVSRAAFECLVLAIQPAFDRFRADHAIMVRLREQAIERGAPERVAVGGAGGGYRGFMVTGPDGEPTASPYPSEQVPVLAAADRLAELLAGAWADMVESLRSERAGEPA